MLAEDEHMPFLTSDACRLYEWILEQGGLDIEAAGGALRLPSASVAAAVDLLACYRLVKRAPARGQFVANRPDVAAAELARPLEREVSSAQRVAEGARNAFETLISAYQSSEHSERSGARLPRFVTDSAHINSLLDELSDRCAHEVLMARPSSPPLPSCLTEILQRDLAMLSRGVRVRGLYQHAARFDVGIRSYVEAVTKAGAEVRSVRELSHAVIIFDRATAFVSAEGEEGYGVLIVRERAVVSFLCAILERTWTNGLTFVGEIKSQNEERALANSVRASILRLLIQGVRDEAIARRMGISVRTCRRHIAEIMKIAGAESRFQAGYMVAGRQLLDAKDGAGRN
ncbi:helix-turn-helix transcriptional regulator [Streptomyces sp. NBC_00247]|uniref:helix-turn-helix transcriptional regulator n=1 Tax=Streptomyces sp. NBC_00247 TaxID=2975689 RepID=UPI002E2CC47F|nr:helix-turn-helix transcriptional regulator [Streptomyces sp. NBC_00247]